MSPSKTAGSRSRRIVPPPLRSGDVVRLLAPGFPPRDDKALVRGVRVLERWGLRVRLGDSVGRRWGYFAGTDDERRADLQEAIDDTGSRGILFVRGGWGTSRIIDRLDLTPLQRRPKVVVGYSDMTVLFAALWNEHRLVCGYGPVVSELGRPRAYHASSLRRALFRPSAPLLLRVPGRSVLVKGRAEGPLVGGCLTLLAHLCGTGRLPDARGAVVFLEEIAEEPYRVDRMLWQLRACGFFQEAEGVLAGQFTACERRAGTRSFTVKEVLADHLGGLGLPVLLDVPAGHGDGKWTLPLGFRARIDGAAGRVSFRP